MNDFLRGWILLLLTLTLAGAEPRVTEGELDGARFVIAAPEKWNGSVLIYAHGLRPEGGELVVELLPLKSASRDLLERGWIIAETSYRRNGLVVADGLADVLALREEIVKRFGALSRVVLHGESMGGAIATLLLEREPAKFSAALAVGAALQLDEKGTPVVFTSQPGGPLLFLSNRTEVEGPRRYVEKSGAAKFPAVLWTADRDGHVNVNQREIGTALAALNRWLDTAQAPAPQDDTLTPDPRPSAMAIEGAIGRAAMTQRNPLFGNITLDFQATDFARLGITRGDTFTLEFGGKRVPVRLGATYSDVPRGQYVAFFDAEDRLLVAINFGNAADALGIKVGDQAVVTKASP